MHKLYLSTEIQYDEHDMFHFLSWFYNTEVCHCTQESAD